MKTKLLTLVTLAFIGLSTANAQVGIGTETPDASAYLDVESASQGFLPPRMTEAERDAIANPATGLTIYNTTEHCVNFYGGFGWTSYCATVPPENILNSQTGRIWMDKNLGAAQVATSPTDADAYGNLYQWGRAADGHEARTSTPYTAVETAPEGVSNYSTGGNPWDGEFIIRSEGENNWLDSNVPNADNLWQGVNGINNPCPSGYKVPTEAEWLNERATWSSNDANGAYESIKLTMGGTRLTGGGLNNVGDQGQYWSSTIDGTGTKRLNILPGFTGFGGSAARALGFLVRCIKELD